MFGFLRKKVPEKISGTVLRVSSNSSPSDASRMFLLLAEYPGRIFHGCNWARGHETLFVEKGDQLCFECNEQGEILDCTFENTTLRAVLAENQGAPA